MIKNEASVPPWLMDLVNQERQLVADNGNRFPTHLGATAFKLYELGGTGWWGWDNGTGGVLLICWEDDHLLSLNYADLEWSDRHGSSHPRCLTRLEIFGLRQLCKSED